MYMNYKSKAQPFRRRILGRKNSIGPHLMSMGIGFGCYQKEGPVGEFHVLASTRTSLRPLEPSISFNT